MVDKKDEQIEYVVKELKPVEKDTKPVAKKTVSNYVVDLLEGNRIVGQVSFDSAKNSLGFAAPDREGRYQLELFVAAVITVDGKDISPVDSPEDWILNLYKVAPLSLYKTWSASEAREIT